MDILQMLKKAAVLPGVSGAEDSAASYFAEELGKFAEVRKDVLGSVIGEVKGEGKHYLLDAHIDRVGMIVTGVDKTGFLRFELCGGTDLRTLAAARVTVWGKEPLTGVIISTPPHLKEKDSESKAVPCDKLAVDIGFVFEKAVKLVKPGDRITLDCEPTELANGRLCAAALDDRSGAAAVIRCLEILQQKNVKKHVTALLSVQEETGGCGAATGAFGIVPDEAICVDVSFASAPDVPPENRGTLGKGVMIGFSPVLDGEMSKRLCAIAEAKEIPYTTEVMGRLTSTNADDVSVSRAGVKTGLLSIPLRNMHTAVEILDVQDVESVAQLMAAYICDTEIG